MRKICFAFLAVAIVFLVNLNIAHAQTFTIGSTVENFNLKDINGQEKTFESLKGTKGTVVVFLSAQCPVVKIYNERLNAIVEEYKNKGITFIGINSNVTENLQKVKTHAEENYKFPMLIDTNNVLADKFGANATPEIFLFDSKNKLTYHGAIDNDRTGENVTGTFLKDALDSQIAGKAIAKTETRAIGCTIKRAQ